MTKTAAIPVPPTSKDTAIPRLTTGSAQESRECGRASVISGLQPMSRLQAYDWSFRIFSLDHKNEGNEPRCREDFNAQRCLTIPGRSATDFPVSSAVS